jgi:hypothetical protein
MRQCILAGSVFALVLAASPAAAQMDRDPGTWVVSLGGGATFPVGNQTAFLKTGIHGAAAVGYELPSDKAMFSVEGRYLYADNKQSSDGHSNILTFMGRGDFGSLQSGPYITLGAGVLRNEYDQPINNIVFRNTHAAFAIEGGVGFAFGKTVFIEGRVLHSFRKAADEYTLIPVTLGIRF